MKAKPSVKKPLDAGDATKTSTPASNSRRRFVGGAGLAIPAILTVKSRSVMAAQCFSPSAQASMNLLNSRLDRPADGVCSGRTPGYWVNSSKTHKTQSLTAGTTSTLFSTIVADPTAFPGKTLADVMQLGGRQDPYQLGAHLAAAWCNLKTGLVASTILDERDLVNMWANRNRGYSPVAGVTWYGADIVTYLKTTQPY